MKSLSLWQPWASAMAIGAKAIETRSWYTSYRGDLVICSSKRKPSPLECGDNETYREALKMPYGCALCVVELYGCAPTERITPLSDRERELGDYTPGRYGWMTRNLRHLTQPVPIVGHQGLFNLTPAEESAVLEQLPFV